LWFHDIVDRCFATVSTSAEVDGPARSSTSTANDPAIGYNLHATLASSRPTQRRRHAVWPPCTTARPPSSGGFRRSPCWLIPASCHTPSVGGLYHVDAEVSLWRGFRRRSPGPGVRCGRPLRRAAVRRDCRRG